MSLTRSELDALRALIRERSGLPDPPPKPVLAPWSPAPPLEEPCVRSRACQPAETTAARAEVLQAAPPAAPGDDAEGKPEPTWRPDTAVHRLVELLMQMRALSSAEPIGSSALAA